MRIGLGLSICDFRPVTGGGGAPAVPAISAITPDFGSSAGGTPVSITGSGFTGATDATVGGITLDSFTVVDDTEITGTTNAVLEGDEDVVVTGPGGSDTLVNGFEFVDPPTVTSVSDEVGGVTEGVGDTAGGVPVTINGTDFTGATGATIGGVAVTSFVVVSDIKITCVTGAHAAGIVDVAVTGLVPGGTPLVGGYEYWNPTAIANCVWWLRADLGVTVNGSTQATAWADQSGSGDANRNLGSGTDKPAYNAVDATYNNKPTIGTFNKNDGSNDCRLRTGVWSTSYATHTTGIIGHGATGGSRYLQDSRTGGAANLNALLNNSAFRCYGAAVGNTLTKAASGAEAATPGALYLGRWNGASSALFCNATSTSSATGDLGAVTFGSSAVSIGGTPAGVQTTFGAEKIAEIFSWSRVLTAGEELKLRKYLNGRYGKTMST